MPSSRSSAGSSPPSPATTRMMDLISFPDGDVVLHSLDGVDFRVDMTILRRASPFFEDSYRIGLPSVCRSASLVGDGGHGANKEEPIMPIPMMESSKVLNTILWLIYPTRTETPPVVDSHSTALELFKAIERLQLNTHVIDTFATNYLSTVEPPIRAWALATRFRYTQARKNAVRRYISEEKKKDNNGNSFPFELEQLEKLRELDLVGARSILKLMRIKHDATELATQAVKSDSFVWYCAHHVHIPWRSKRASIIAANPFDPVPRSDDVLGAIVCHIGCADCLLRFRHSTTSIPRTIISRSIAALLDSAAELEAQDDYYDDSDEEGARNGNGNGSKGGKARVRLTMRPLPPPPGPLFP